MFELSEQSDDRLDQEAIKDIAAFWTNAINAIKLESLKKSFRITVSYSLDLDDLDEETGDALRMAISEEEAN